MSAIVQHKTASSAVPSSLPSPAAVELEHGYKVGDIVQDDRGAVGYVRYIGAVATSKKATTMWTGVEWSDNTRGKHDGSVTDKQGKVHRYFTCPQGCGSFVKPGKVHGGKDFLTSIMEKYQPELLQTSNTESENKAADNQGLAYGNGKPLAIEPVGMDRIRSKQQLVNLREVSVPCSGVSHLSKHHQQDLTERCPNIRQLNLADNLLRQWSEIGEIARRLPALEHIDVSRNPLMSLPSNPLTLLPDSIRLHNPFDHVKELVLVGTKVHISQLQILDDKGLLPNLEELFLGNNGLTVLDPNEDVKSDSVNHERGTYAEWAKQQIVETDRKGFTPLSFVRGFAKLKTLDLSNNNISSWSEIWRVCRLSKLEVLNISGNPIEEVFYDKPAVEEAQEQDAATTPVDDEKLKQIEQQRLEAAKEFVDEVEHGIVPEKKEVTEEESMPTRGIMMSNGYVIPIPDKLQRPKANPARIFKGDGTRGGAWPFACLRFINLSRSRVAKWDSIDALNQFPSLRNVRIKEIPLISLSSTNAGIFRQTVIARVGSLAHLNGSEIRPRERSDAERLYLKRTAMENKDALESDGFKAAHQRYAELVETHGDPLATMGTERNDDGSLKSNMLNVTIRTFDPRTCTVPPAKKKLPMSMTIGNLKVLCQRIFGVDAALQKLFYRENKTDFGHPIQLDDDASQLVYFGVQDGGEIIIEAIDPEKERKEAEKRAKHEADRVRKEEERLARETNRAREQLASAQLK